MTVSANYAGNLASPQVRTLGGTSTETVLTATDNTMTVASWSFFNTTGGSVNCSLYWFDGTTERPIWGKPVATLDTQVESDIPLRIRTGHQIRAKGANGVAVTLAVSLSSQNS